MDASFKRNHTALKLDPDHNGAHEYIGVAYLKVNQPEKAKEHLAKMETICGKKCEEYEDLARAIKCPSGQEIVLARGCGYSFNGIQIAVFKFAGAVLRASFKYSSKHG